MYEAKSEDIFLEPRHARQLKKLVDGGAQAGLVRSPVDITAV